MRVRFTSRRCISLVPDYGSPNKRFVSLPFISGHISLHALRPYWSVAELRGGRDEPDDGDSSARRFPADADDGAAEIPSRTEPRTRAEYADAIRQATGPGSPDQAAADQEDTDQVGTDQEDAGQGHTGQDDASQGDADQVDADPQTEAPGPGALERFEPRRAGLPEVSHEDAATYIEEHQADRPWLTQARDCSPDAQRVIVALDRGHGHAHIRHEGWVTEEMNARRVRNLEDPAQLDPAKREARIDGLTTGSLPHRCGDIASRVTDPEAFASAFARGVEHPDVWAALDSTGPRPDPVTLPLSDVLGDDGHKFCSGWQLEPVNGSMDEARASRREWVAGNQSGPEPRVRPVETFEGGMVTFAFRRSTVGGYEVSTMYVSPPDEQPT
jgi:hypothetical protein